MTSCAKNLRFIPGFATTNLVWEEQKKLLGSDFEIVDEKADCIIAWSMGCYDAVHLYFQDPKKVKKLVLKYKVSDNLGLKAMKKVQKMMRKIYKKIFNIILFFIISKLTKFFIILY